MQKQKSESRIAVYYELTKPKIWYLLVFTAFGAALTASHIYNIEISPATWLLMLFSIAAGSAAANTLTNYHDRDIDAIMERTKGRPLPSKRIFPAVKARNFGLVLAGISLVLALGISFTTTLEQGVWATMFIAFGLANNVLVYSYGLKRNSRTNIILGGLCGGSPPMIGWVAVTMTDLWTAIASGALMVGLSIWVIMKPVEKASWTLFKFSSPYLAVLFIALMVDSAL